MPFASEPVLSGTTLSRTAMIQPSGFLLSLGNWPSNLHRIYILLLHDSCGTIVLFGRSIKGVMKESNVEMDFGDLGSTGGSCDCRGRVLGLAESFANDHKLQALYGTAESSGHAHCAQWAESADGSSGLRRWWSLSHGWLGLSRAHDGGWSFLALRPFHAVWHGFLLPGRPVQADHPAWPPGSGRCPLLSDGEARGYLAGARADVLCSTGSISGSYAGSEACKETITVQ